MKKKLLMAALALTVIAPTSVFASPIGINAHGQYHEKKMQERQERLMELVKKYTPELTNDFQKVYDERKQMLVQYKSQHEEMKKKIQDIHDKLSKGEITKDQARQEMEKLGFKGERGNKHFELRKQLDEAVDAKDEAKIKSLLPQILSQMKERNKDFGERFKTK